MRRCKVLKEVEALTRITGRSGYALVYVGENRVNEKGDAPGEMKPMAVLDVLAKLAAYEATGIEPEEIRERMRKKTILESDFNRLHRISGMLDALQDVVLQKMVIEGEALKKATTLLREVLRNV